MMLSGGYLIYKPKGLTSRRVDNILGKLLRMKRIGHIGTLDPLAEGLLPVLVGTATRIAPFVDNNIKGYKVRITLGTGTTTDDSEGDVIESKPVQVPASRIIENLKAFLGEIDQVPPKFSAKKIDGVPMYKRARRNEEVVVQPKKVIVYSIDDVHIALPDVSFSIICGTGTYLRAIARDLGHRLGCGGYLSALIRTSVGNHNVSDAADFEEVIQSIKSDNSDKFLKSELDMLPHLPKIQVGQIEAWKVQQGQILFGLASKIKTAQLFLIVSNDNELLAVTEKTPGGYKYKRVLA